MDAVRVLGEEFAGPAGLQQRGQQAGELGEASGGGRGQVDLREIAAEPFEVAAHLVQSGRRIREAGQRRPLRRGDQRARAVQTGETRSAETVVVAARSTPLISSSLLRRTTSIAR